MKEVSLPLRVRRNLMLSDRFSACIRWWVNTSSRSSAYSLKDVRSIHRSWICSSSSSSYKTSKIICVPHVTPVNSPAVLHLTILKLWPCHAKTTRKLPSTAPATKIQPCDSEVVALPRKNNTKVTKYCTCQKNPTLRFGSRDPVTQKQPKSHKVRHLPQNSTLRSLWLKKHKKKCKS